MDWQPWILDVDKHMERWLPLPEAEPKELHAAMRYSALAPGKRFRPLLCLFSCFAVGGDPEVALDAGCALEFIHAFSLIHDDLPAIDNDTLRRGRPTCHIEFGEATAILAGDALFALAFQVLASLPDPVVANHCSLLLAQSCGTKGLVGGEMLDILAERGERDSDFLQVIHERKTAALLQCACELGAVVGRGTADQQQLLRQFGFALGIAFQIRDDILDIEGTTQELGKDQGSDEARGKLTYPQVYGLNRSREMATEWVEAASEALKTFDERADPLRQLLEFTVSRRK